MADHTTDNQEKQAFIASINNGFREMTVHTMLRDRAHLSPVPQVQDGDLPIIRLNCNHADMMETVHDYLFHGAHKGNWNQACLHYAPHMVYIPIDGEAWIGADAAKTGLRAQLKFLPYARFNRVSYIVPHCNQVVFMIWNDLVPRQNPRTPDTPPTRYTVPNISEVYYFGRDKQTGVGQFHFCQDWYNTTTFVATILKYLAEDAENGGDAAIKFAEAGGHAFLESLQAAAKRGIEMIASHLHA